ncbi:cupin domain-containing protein [Kangiella sp. HZ709]|uniref:cupin domain-containing protein n=1 Tax=Kangiella sp. HZ709 TaxID=2666328 RepID=UPI00351BCEE1
MQACDFMPRWRLDDVMVSFASDQGSVGPHLDQYDVFLIQGSGTRRWRVGEKNQAITKHSPHPEISQIKAFATDLDITVKAGDLLYIPPNTPHWGESIGDSICYSVGFRAPNLEALTQQLLEESNEQLSSLWSDKDILSASNSGGEVNAQISDWVGNEIHKLTIDNKLNIAVGKEVTQLKYPELLAEVSLCEAQELSELAFVASFKLNSISRLAYFKEENDLMVFANGHYISTSADVLELVIALNNYETIRLENFNINRDVIRNFLYELILTTALEFVE